MKKQHENHIIQADIESNFYPAISKMLNKSLFILVIFHPALYFYKTSYIMRLQIYTYNSAHLGLRLLKRGSP